MLLRKTRFRPLLSPFIARFIIIIIETVFGRQSPSKDGSDKGSKWGPGPLNTPVEDVNKIMSNHIHVYHKPTSIIVSRLPTSKTIQAISSFHNHIL